MGSLGGMLGGAAGSAATGASQWLNSPAFGTQYAPGPMQSGAAGVPLAGTGVTYGDLLSAARGGQGVTNLTKKAADQGMIPGITGMQGDEKQGSGDQALGAIMSIIPYLI